MNASNGLGRVCCITVTYQPDLSVLRRQMQALPPACRRVVVDNASDPTLLVLLRDLAAEFGAALEVNATNAGLASAQNQGATTAIRLFPDAEFLLFLDQDTEADASGVATLLAGYRSAASERGPGAAGPRMIDVATGMHHGFHIIRDLRWLRIYPYPSQRTPVECANLNGSGTLVPIDVWRASGGMDESLFIDHVDTDWAFRMLARGYRLYGIPAAQFTHRMGEATMRVWLFGWHLWPTRSPTRHYYLFRNTVRLMRRSYVPVLWKAWAGIKLLVTSFVVPLVDSRGRQQITQMLAGLRAGFREDPSQTDYATERPNPPP